MSTAILLLLPVLIYGQQYSFKGRVSDAATGDPIPFVNVYLEGTTKGATTDFEGFFSFSSTFLKDSLVASYVGYESKSVALVKGKNVYNINFRLKSGAVRLQEVVVTQKGYENPAWEILRNVISNKADHNLEKLDAYQFESYTRNELSVDNITDRFKQKKIVRDMINAVEDKGVQVGDDGKPVLPVFVSETLSNVFFINNPKRKTEYVLKTKISGIGVEDGSIVSQLTGSTFLDYNFYQNWVTILAKDFISPIADGWSGFYEYELDLSRMYPIDDINCYKISFTPKRDQDLAFRGTMWITDSTENYALKQIDVTIGKEANLNFIDQIKIQQELLKVENAWLPKKTRILLDIGNVNDQWGGVLAKSYVSNKDFVINKRKDPEFYSVEVEVAEDARLAAPETYWVQARHDSLSDEDKLVYQVIDTLNNLPRVKTLVDVMDFLINGYVDIGTVNLGTYSQLYAYNDVEESRIQVGATTDTDFSRKWKLDGFLAYGFGDEKLKYNFGLTYILNRDRWMRAGFMTTFDMQQVGVYDDNKEQSTLFQAATRWGNINLPFYNTLNKVWWGTDIVRGLSFQLALKNRFFDPLFPFEYSYESDGSDVKDNFTTTELVSELVYAPGNRYIQTDYNTRLVLTRDDRPRLTFRYTYGIPNLLGGDFEYHKVYASIEQTFRLGALGRTDYILAGGYVREILPYPLLENHLGNEISIFYNDNAYNLMRFGEFVSDKFASLNVTHRFEGIIMNKVPLFRKLKWRLLASGRILYGSARDANREIILVDPAPELLNTLNDGPYAEVSYGIENILRVIRVDFIHRLAYTESRGQDFAIKVSAVLRF
ncbi:DUF5686 family protein [Limibacter armeniacum]|uniref:DUF5686 and carboxypeptidase-like regulatory domain-containing protein n=1 Tax=Limibacter armeniacum TaxID=466084 RepID=UPI002FE62CE2